MHTVVGWPGQRDTARTEGLGKVYKSRRANGASKGNLRNRKGRSRPEDALGSVCKDHRGKPGVI